MLPTRRGLLLAGTTLALPAWAATGDAGDRFERALRSSLGTGAGKGAVILFRHALAPGTFDPPGFKLNDCSTQRNLNDEGRRQAQLIGAWFTARQLRPARVRSSPWCRCLDTARLAFGDKTEAWAALGSPRAGTEAVNTQALAQLRTGLTAAAQQRGGFEVWVTHMFVFSALLGNGEGAASGEGALLGLGPDGAPRVIERLLVAGS
jgi:Histidine phosphatase superfamily (branch 1)